ncbi:hypothetical protein D3C85_1752790 [compost metagenome]
MRRVWPSELGVMPRSDLRMAFSMAERALRSNGEIWRVRASGTEIVAMLLMAVIEP